MNRRGEEQTERLFGESGRFPVVIPSLMSKGRPQNGGSCETLGPPTKRKKSLGDLVAPDVFS